MTGNPEHEFLKFYFDADLVEFCSKRASNPKSVLPANHNQIAKSIDKLAECKLGSGHDVFLNGLMVYFDWNISKIVREQLLRYNFINVISSQSLMHKLHEHIANESSWADVPKEIREGFLKYYEGGHTDIEVVNSLPLGFRYEISFCCNYRQLKTIYSQRKEHKLKDWRDFCNELELLPNSHWITGKK